MSDDTTFYLAGCVITNPDKKILMIHRNSPTRVQWEIPGGKIDPGEDARATAARELKEELDLEVEVRDQLGEKHFEDEGRTMHYTWFAANVVGGQPRVMEPHVHDKFAYYSVDELKAMHHELSSNTRNFLDAVTRGDIRL